jgi:hypothetical protein
MHERIGSVGRSKINRGWSCWIVLIKLGYRGQVSGVEVQPAKHCARGYKNHSAGDRDRHDSAEQPHGMNLNPMFVSRTDNWRKQAMSQACAVSSPLCGVSERNDDFSLIIQPNLQ